MSAYLSLYGMAVCILVFGFAAVLYAFRPSVSLPGQWYLRYVGAAFILVGVVMVGTVVSFRV